MQLIGPHVRFLSILSMVTPPNNPIDLIPLQPDSHVLQSASTYEQYIHE